MLRFAGADVLKCVVREDLVTNPFRRVVFYKDSLRLSFHDQNKIPTWIQTLSWWFHLQSTVYIKEADLLMRAGNDGEHQTALVETLRALTRTASRGTFDAAGEKKEVSIWK